MAAEAAVAAAGTLTTVPAEVARVAAAFGARAFFGLAGSGNFVLTHELRDAGLTYYAATQEGACVAMADGYARSTGATGVATVHQGPGLTNAVTALREAVRSHSPLVLLAADVPAGATTHNQHVDEAAVARSVDAGVESVVSPELVGERVASAFRRAAGEQRPIVVTLPIDIQDSVTAPATTDPWSERAPVPPAPDEASAARAAELLGGAERPVILAGRGATRNPDARDTIAALAECVGAPLLTTTRAHSLFAGHRFDLGVAGGFGTDGARETLRRADVVVVLGASMNPWTLAHDDRLTERAQVIRVDTDAVALNSGPRVAVPIVADCAVTARALCRLIRRTDREAPLTRADAGAEVTAVDPRGSPGDNPRLDPRVLTRWLDEKLPFERTVSIDSGHFMIFPAKQMRAPDPAGFVLAQGFMSMGLALSEGLGAAAGRPERLAAVMLGDGGAKMSLFELDTAVRHGLPVLVVIYNDAAYGAEVHDFAGSGRSLDIVQFQDIDFAAAARAMGAHAVSARSLGDLGPVERWLGDRDRPMVIDAKVDAAVRGDWIE